MSAANTNGRDGEALARTGGGSLEVAAEYGFRRAEIEEIKKTIAKGATDVELAVFLRTAQRLGLDPFARHIFLIKRWQKGGDVMTPQVSIDGFRLVAERTAKYMPGHRPEYTYDGDGKLVSAIAFIKKQDEQGIWHDVDCEAFYDEYVQKTGQGAVNSMWTKMPRVMLAKCAEALALRKAFPQQLSGVYTNEEMGQASEAAEHPPEDVRATPRRRARDEFEASAEFEKSGARGVTVEGAVVDDEEEEARAIREENAQPVASGATPELDVEIAEEFAKLVGVMTETYSIAPKTEKARYRPLGTLKNYVNLTYRVSDGFDSLDGERKAELLKSLHELRKRAAQDLNTFLQQIGERE